MKMSFLVKIIMWRIKMDGNLNNLQKLLGSENTSGAK
jgi:hypothetical protein